MVVRLCWHFTLDFLHSVVVCPICCSLGIVWACMYVCMPGINHRGKRYFVGQSYEKHPDLGEFLFSDLM